MGSETFYPAVSGDDGRRYSPSAPQLYTAWSYASIGCQYNALNHAFIRFPNVTIPQGAVITSAFIRFTAYSSRSGTTVNAKIYFNDADDASAPTTYTEFDNVSLTTEFTAWDNIGAWTDGAQYDSPSLVDALQEVVDRAGFSSGNAIMAMIYNNGSDTNEYRNFSSVDYDGGSEVAELHITLASNIDVSATCASLTATPHTAAIIGATTVSAEIASLTISTFRTAQHVEVEPAVVILVIAVQPISIFYGTLISANSVSLTATANAALVVFNTPVDTATISLIISSNAAIISWDLDIQATSAALTITPYDAVVWDGAAWTVWLAANAGKVIRKYIFTLTGEDDGEEDIDIPFSSFQCRRRDGEPTYLSIVVKGLDYSSAIAARSNGDMKITMSYIVNGTTVYEDIISIVDLEDIQIDRGSSNQSISLTGYRTISYTPKSIELRDVTYYRLKDGKYIYRCAAPDLYLAPGDTATFGDTSFVVDQVQYTVSVLSQMMQVKEA